MRPYNDISKYKRVIAIGDIHGHHKLLIKLLYNIGPIHDDLLVFMGDYLDRGNSWDEELNVVEELITLQDKYPNNVILLKGNHDLMLETVLKKNDKDSFMFEVWLKNGGNAMWLDDRYSALIHNFHQRMKLFYETKDFIFVHAGATEESLHPEETNHNPLLWDRNFNQQRCFGKRLVVGHTPSKSIVVTTDKICVDTGAFKYGILSGYDVLNEKEYYVSY